MSTENLNFLNLMHKFLSRKKLRPNNYLGVIFQLETTRNKVAYLGV